MEKRLPYSSRKHFISCSRAIFLACTITNCNWASNRPLLTWSCHVPLKPLYLYIPFPIHIVEQSLLLSHLIIKPSSSLSHIYHHTVLYKKCSHSCQPLTTSLHGPYPLVSKNNYTNNGSLPPIPLYCSSCFGVW